MSEQTEYPTIAWQKWRDPEWPSMPGAWSRQHQYTTDMALTDRTLCGLAVPADMANYSDDAIGSGPCLRCRRISGRAA